MPLALSTELKIRSLYNAKYTLTFTLSCWGKFSHSLFYFSQSILCESKRAWKEIEKSFWTLYSFLFYSSVIFFCTWQSSRWRCEVNKSVFELLPRSFTRYNTLKSPTFRIREYSMLVASILFDIDYLVPWHCLYISSQCMQIPGRNIWLN